MSFLKEEIFLNAEKNKFKVPPDIWIQIRETHTIEDIRSFIQQLIFKYDIPFPYQEYTDIELKNHFSILKNIDVYENLGFYKWENNRSKIDTPFTYKGTPIYIKQSLVGRPCSNRFMQYDRMKAYTKAKGVSPLDIWKSKDKLHKFNFAIKHCELLDCSNLRASLRMSYSIPSQFSTMVAKTIYEITQAKNVLDFSGGWGDRLVGALSTDSVVSYTGIDPNTALHPKYEEISSFYKHNKKTKFICAPAEDADLESNQFDVIFTSPPYFDLEIYSQEETQSVSKYQKTEDWLDKFLFKMIEKSFSWLKDDGRLILNISDYKNIFFNQKMIEYANNIGFKYEGVIGYELMQRPGDNTSRELFAEKGAIFCEPIFVFAKGNPPDLVLENQNTLF